MRGFGTFAAAVVLLMGFGQTASAAAISPGSEIGFFGAADLVGGSDLNSATGFSFAGPGLVSAGLGDFVSAVGGPVFIAGFDFAPPSLGALLSFGGIPFGAGGIGGGGFTATSLVVDFQSATALDITLGGFWSLDGFDDTQGQVVMTFDHLGGLTTYSGVGNVVIPLPGALLFFLSSLVGVGALRRRGS